MAMTSVTVIGYPAPRKEQTGEYPHTAALSTIVASTARQTIFQIVQPPLIRRPPL